MKNDDLLGDQPIQPKFIEQMNNVAKGLDEIFNPGLKAPHKKVGFVLLVFPYGDTEGRCNYISNGADRRDICTMFREQIARFEGQAEFKVRGKQ
jgi:hypothetical protein